MSNSLLAHLFTHIKGSQEDIATYSLQYLLDSSIELSDSFSKYISHLLHIDEMSNVTYQCQRSGDNLERPDMSGTILDKEIVLLEAKFYASLTDNQPIAYIDRLKNNNGKGLLFIVPKSRKILVWKEILDRCSNIMLENINKFCCKVNNVNMAIVSWDELLEYLKLEITANHSELTHDLYQLIGFYKEIEENSFVPYNTEDFDQSTAKKIGSFYEVVEETFKCFLSDKTLHTKTKGKTYYSSYRKGYYSKICVDEIWVHINFVIDAWQRTDTIDTPFWVVLQSDDHIIQDKINYLLSTLPKEKVCKPFTYWHMIALPTKTHATIDEVANDLKKQILNYIKMIYDI